MRSEINDGETAQRRSHFTRELQFNTNCRFIKNVNEKGKIPKLTRPYCLSEWFSLITSRGVRVSGPMLKCKAEELSQKIGNNQFIATDSWLSRWKNRHETKFKRVHGEKASADESANYS